MPEDNINEFTKVLGEEEDQELEVEDPEEEEEEKEEENEEDLEEENEENDDEEKKFKKTKVNEEDSENVEIPSFKAVIKKYPNLFKDFPHFRHVFFHAKEYREIFPTLEEARGAVEDLKAFKDLEDSLVSGKPEDIIKVIESINELDEKAVPNLANNFLSSIRKVNQDLYFQVITPELVNFTRQMYRAGVKNGNDNLKNAALVASLHFFDDPKIASGEKDIKLPNAQKKEDVKDDKLERERANFRQEKYSALYNDVVSSFDSQLAEAISDGLDPKNNMTEGIKELIVEKVMKEISKVLSSSKIHSNKMTSLWRRAGDDGFSSSHKSRIVSASLGAAKEIMPRIRAKVRASVLGIRERHSEEQTGSREKRVEPKSTVGGGRQSSNGKIDPKKVDWRKTSDLDFIKDNVTLKS